MNPTWNEAESPDPKSISLLAWPRVLVKGILLVLVIGVGLIVLLLSRLVERPVFGEQRPITPHITQIVCRLALIIMGIRFRTNGELMRANGAVVANHASWIDIFALNARKRIYFVSKSEVAGWPGIGWLARATGTVFINRDRREAGAQVRLFEERLSLGHKLLFFPEGTSSDSRRVLPFKTTLFAAFFAPALPDDLQIQPVTVIYHTPKGRDPRFYGWYGDMAMAPHLLSVLAKGGGGVDLIYHPPVRITDFADRKQLAAHCEAQVRMGLEVVIGPPG